MHESGDEGREVPSGLGRVVTLGHERVGRWRARAEHTFEKYRDRPFVDLGMRVYERDHEAAGTVIGSALAFRLFLFFIPMLLFVVGLLGFFGDAVAPDVVEEARVTGTVAEQIDNALDQANSTRWIATLTGLVGMASTGRALSRALWQASCLNWALPVRAKASIRTIGAIVGVVVGLGLASAVTNRIHDQLGLGFAGLSYVAMAAIYLVSWTVIFAILPRAESEPSAVLPGAAVIAVTMAAMQAVSQLYLPSRFERASELYGAIGASLVVLGWFFIVGRAVVLAMALNASIFEKFGRISEMVFSLPLLRGIPPRSPWIARTFGLDDERVADPDH